MANVLSLVWDTVIVLNVNKPIGYAEVLLPVQLETVSFRHVAVSCIRGMFPYLSISSGKRIQNGITRFPSARL